MTEGLSTTTELWTLHQQAVTAASGQQHTAVCYGRHVTLYLVTASTAVLSYAHVALGQDFGVLFRPSIHNRC